MNGPMSTQVLNVSCAYSSGMSRVAASHLVDRAQILPVTIEETRLDGVLEGWKRELRRKILFLDDEPQDFLRRFVPSNAPALPHTNIGDVFRNWRSEKGKEVESYEGLVCRLLHQSSQFIYLLMSRYNA